MVSEFSFLRKSTERKSMVRSTTCGIFHKNSCLLQLRGVHGIMRYCYVIILMRFVLGLSQRVILIIVTLISSY